MISDETIKEWVKERDEVVLSYDVERFRAFYEKWKALGVYELDLPDNDFVVEVAMRNMVGMMASATPEQKEDAKQWLLERGFSAWE